MDRRDFIAYGSAGALALTLLRAQADQEAEAQTTYDFELHMEEIYEEQIDGEVDAGQEPRRKEEEPGPRS